MYTTAAYDEDPTPFASAERDAFSGLALAIVRARAGSAGGIVVTAESNGLGHGEFVVTAELPNSRLE